MVEEAFLSPRLGTGPYVYLTIVLEVFYRQRSVKEVIRTYSSVRDYLTLYIHTTVSEVLLPLEPSLGPSGPISLLLNYSAGGCGTIMDLQ